MSTQNNGDNTAKFINNMILLFIGGIIAIAVLGFINGGINWTGIVVVLVVIAALLAYRGRSNKKSK
jgi:membrane protein implicated in regulation of membrane protease activity